MLKKHNPFPNSNRNYKQNDNKCNMKWERLSSMKKTIYDIEGHEKGLNKWAMSTERHWMRKLLLSSQILLSEIQCQL